LISVVITCYNYGKFLPGCIDCVLNQTYQDFEIVIVNDGSNDDTNQVIQPYLDHSQIIYIDQPNAGQATAKNIGIKNASGDFIAFLDADDLWEKAKLEKQIALFNDHSVGVVYCNASLIDEDGHHVDSIIFEETNQFKAGKITEYLFLNNFIPFSSSVIRKECFKDFGIFDEGYKMGIDWDLWLRISTKYKFQYVDEPLLLYRVGHAGQMSKNLEVRHKDAEMIMECFLKNYPDVISASVVKKGYYLTYCNRGYYYSDKNLRVALSNYLKALQFSLLNITAYKGIVKTLINFKL